MSKTILSPFKLNPIYKVNYLNGTSSPHSILVFFGNNVDIEDPEELFKREPTNIVFKNIFNKKEYQNIKEQNIPVKFSKQQIHFDDTIGVIKMKIAIEFSKQISLEEIYMFCLKEETINPITLFQSLTQNNKLDLTRVRLDQFLFNVKDENGESIKFNIPEKDKYEYDDIMALNLTDKKYLINKVLGQKIVLVSNEYPFVCNPFSVIEYDNFIEKSARKSLTTLNSHLLLNTGDIVDNNIYLCLAADVLANAINKNLSEPTTIQLYYPLLSKNSADIQIQSLDDLESKKQFLLEENNTKYFNSDTNEIFQGIDLFYDIYKERTDELRYKTRGIKYIKAVIRPTYKIKIPLDIVFKLIHATEMNPLIKFNPASRQENIFRLYANKTAKDGRKIPFLSKPDILKLMRNIGKTKSVVVLINSSVNDNKINSLLCEFEYNGNITIECDFKKIVSLEESEDIFKKYINPIINEVKVYLEQSGYTINLFENLYNENVEIKRIDYQTVIELADDATFEINDIMGCLTNIFIVESKNLENGIDMRFKRIANFNKMTSQEAFVIEQANDKNGLRGNELRRALMENYKIKEAVANELIARMASELQVERGIKGNDIEIKMNPGFKTTIIGTRNLGIITITVENINDIQYLSTIPIYLDSFIRLTQDTPNKRSTRVPLDLVNTLCSGNEKKEITMIDIISPLEQAFPDQEVAIIEGDTVIYKPYDENDYISDDEDTGKRQNALDLLYGNEDEEEEEEDLGGGSLHRGGGGENTKKTFKSIDGMKLNNPNIFQKRMEDRDPKLFKITGQKSYASICNGSKSGRRQPVILNEEELNQIKTEQPNLLKGDDVIKYGSDTNNPNYFICPRFWCIKTNKPIDPSEIIEEKNSKGEVVRRYHPTCGEVISQDEKKIKPGAYIYEFFSPAEHGTLTNYKKHVPGVQKASAHPEGLCLPCCFSVGSQKIDLDLMNLIFSKFKSSKLTATQLLEPIGISIAEATKSLSPSKLKNTNEGIELVKKVFSVRLSESVTENEAYQLLKPYGINESEAATILANNYIAVLKFMVSGEKNISQSIKERIKDIEEKNETSTFEEKKRECIQKEETKKIKEAQSDGQDGEREKGEGQEQEETEEEKERGEKEEDDEEDEDELLERAPLKKKEDKDDYIQGSEKFPMEPVGRWGRLPLSIQQFFKETDSPCQSNKTVTSIKTNQTCLLRHAVEKNSKQSFIACIADARFYGESKIQTIAEMKETIIKAINIDSYITYQNGNILTMFTPKDEVEMTQENIDKYSDSKIYKKIYKKNSSNEDRYLKTVIASFENFIRYLRDKQSFIDYTYLWDIVCKADIIFPKGINLIILEITGNENINIEETNIVKMICPTNHYSNEFYNEDKQTLFLIKNKKNNCYEPIYAYTNKENNKIKIDKTFSEHYPQLSNVMKKIFTKVIKPVLRDMCVPFSSMPNNYNKKYKFKRAIIASTLINNLKKIKYTVEHQVVNYQSKVIGIISTNKSKEFVGFMPCYPSSIDYDYDYVYMNENNLYSTYENTVSFLTNLYEDGKGKIPSSPKFKIVDDSDKETGAVVVGILTETNQFVQLSKSIPLTDITDDIPQLKNSNYIMNKDSIPMLSSDASISISNNIDTDRVEYIKKIKLETNFYNVFRNTIRILLNDYENIRLREKIEEEIKNPYNPYNDKLNTINKYLKELVKDTIIFTEKYDYNLINEITTCLVTPIDKCSDKQPLCATTQNNKCQLVLPRNNLLTKNSNNEIYYFGRMTDELIRYNRIKSFIFQPQSYLSFGSLGYNLKDDEIIVIQSLLTSEYFDGLIPETINKYVAYNTYDTANPIISQVYDNKINVNEVENAKDKTEIAAIEPLIQENEQPSPIIIIKKKSKKNKTSKNNVTKKNMSD